MVILRHYRKTVFLHLPQKSVVMPVPPPGIISVKSLHSVKESMNRLQEILLSKGITVFARIDQQAEAQKAGLQMLPLELIVFGNPKAGTPIMSSFPLAALDLPLKVISWQDSDNNVWLSYNEPAYLQQRFSLPDALVKNIDFGPLVRLAVS